MLPLQIIIILAILFLLVLCCMIVTQLAPGRIPIPDDEAATSVELATQPTEFLRSHEQRPADCRASARHEFHCPRS